MTKNEQMDALKNALASLDPEFLEIVDESDKHEGHGGWRAGQVTHIHVRIKAPIFAELTRVSRHRAVTDALAPFMPDRLHAVRISIIG